MERLSRGTLQAQLLNLLVPVPTAARRRQGSGRGSTRQPESSQGTGSQLETRTEFHPSAPE